MGRTEKNLNREWKFTYGEWHPQTEEETASWSDVGIPHSFGIPYFMENEFYTGYGTYYKKICVSEKERDQKLLLEFSGVFQVAEVYWNGELLKVHKGGYTPFVWNLPEKQKRKMIWWSASTTCGMDGLPQERENISLTEAFTGMCVSLFLPKAV